MSSGPDREVEHAPGSTLAGPPPILPREVELDPHGGPLIATFGMSEIEYAVARIVVACQIGNRWRPVSLQEIRDACSCDPWRQGWAAIGDVEGDLREAMHCEWVQAVEGGKFELVPEAIERLGLRRRKAAR